MALTAPHATRTLALNGLTITATLSRNAVTLARKCRESRNPSAPTPPGNLTAFNYYACTFTLHTDSYDDRTQVLISTDRNHFFFIRISTGH